MPIRMKSPEKYASDIHENGFVCLYFLILFLLSAVLISVVLNNLTDRMKTADNLKRANELIGQEAAVLQAVRCGLKNSTLEDGTYEENGVSYSVRRRGNRIDITISSPVDEVLQVQLEDEEHVYDYEVIRSELPSYVKDAGIPASFNWFSARSEQICAHIDKIRICLLLLSDRRSIAMPRIDPEIIRKFLNLCQRFQHLKVISPIKICPSDRTGKQRISGKQPVPVTDDDRPSGMTRGMVNCELKRTDLQFSFVQRSKCGI